MTTTIERRATADLSRRTWVHHVMGMPVSVLVRGPAARSASMQDAVGHVFAELHEVDAIFSTYRHDSEISRLARGELRRVDCSPVVEQVLTLCEEARLTTGGWFEHALPGPNGRPRLDPSGLVKGWAAERAARNLASVPGHDWLLNAGGDVVLHTSGAPFQVGVESPTDPAALLDVVAMTSGAVATSGAYHRGGHVRDPRTGVPATALSAVTVVGPSLQHADVLATAAFAEGLASLDRIENLEQYEALLVLSDGFGVTTSGWRGRLGG